MMSSSTLYNKGRTVIQLPAEKEGSIQVDADCIPPTIQGHVLDTYILGWPDTYEQYDLAHSSPDYDLQLQVGQQSRYHGTQ
jgi:hypothetical protein